MEKIINANEPGLHTVKITESCWLNGELLKAGDVVTVGNAEFIQLMAANRGVEVEAAVTGGTGETEEELN